VGTRVGSSSSVGAFVVGVTIGDEEGEFVSPNVGSKVPGGTSRCLVGLPVGSNGKVTFNDGDAVGVDHAGASVGRPVSSSHGSLSSPTTVIVMVAASHSPRPSHAS